MLDSKLLRENSDQVRSALRKRSTDEGLLDQFLAIDDEWRRLIVEADGLKNQRNQQSKGKPSPEALQLLKMISAKIKELDTLILEKEKAIRDIQLMIPNMPDPDVVNGSTSTDNVVLRQWGSPRRFDFTPKEHDEIGTRLGLLDFESGVKLSGARFVVYKGWGAKLERALINFMLDIQTQENRYREILPPFLVNTASMTGTGQLPKFAEDLFACRDNDLWLIPTAEVPLTNLHRDEILEGVRLPLKYTAYTPCFRREAGSYGKDTKGIIRQHQFNKVELVQFVKPEDSAAALETLTGHAELILQRLGLPYRVIQLCTGDLGFASAKTYDLEVWFPSQQCYREISSCSNFREFGCPA